MKKNTLLALALLGLSLALSSCKKDDFTADAVSTTVKSGTWKVTTYTEDGASHLGDFSAYTFTFNANGTALAVNSADSVSGTWSTLDSDDDNTAHFVLNFGATSPWDDLSDDWHVTDQTETVLSLEDVSGGNGGVDILVFTKQ
jgi:hypothetical protein